MKRPFLYSKLLLSALTVGATALVAAAKPTADADGKLSQRRAALMKTAAGCRDAEAAIDLDINNVRARIMTGGDMWWDRGTGEPRYEIPKGSRRNSLFAGALWVGGYDTQGQLKVAAQTFRQAGNDYWTGPMDAVNAIDEATCTAWDRFWKVNLSDVEVFRDLIRRGQAREVDVNPAYASIREWPAFGNIDAVGSDGNSITGNMLPGRQYAPFVDVDNDGIYNWEIGDYPKIDVNDDCQTVLPNPDQFIFSIYNDVGDAKTQTGSDGIGLEVQRTAFAFSTKDFLNDATFYNYRLINRGALTLDSCHTATWTDADLGFENDDYIGCDTARGLGILYNASGQDGTGQVKAYGQQVPMIGVDFFIGPKRFYVDQNGQDSAVKLKMSKFTYFNNATGPAEIQDPRNAIEFFRYMTGTNRAGNPFTNDFTGAAGVQTDAFGSGPNINFVFTGDPGVPGTWSECYSNNAPGDRRFVHSAGPFRLTGGGVTNDITIGICWVNNTGGCPSTSFRKIRVADDAIQELFDNCFSTIEGPHAPRVVIREMNRQLVFNLFNDSASNNFREGYGTDRSDPKYLVSTAKSRVDGDSFYKFEGYRVFQLRDAQITPAQIFNENGEIDDEVAKEVFQCDLRNGIGSADSPIVNFALRTELAPQRWQAQLKVQGKDSGVRHSFAITEDAFSTGQDKKLVNYKTYRYVVVAYGYNNFETFNEDSAEVTQDRAYIESAKYAEGNRLLPLRVWEAMPNPANGNMGTTLNSGLGDGVQITRYEGMGNGGNIVDLETESENEAMRGPDYISKAPKYRMGAGPVRVQVADPLKVVEADWELRVRGPLLGGDRGINPALGQWVLINTASTDSSDWIYSERNLERPNEQILEAYGISINIEQAARPGDLPAEGNGYLTSDVTYDDRTKSWMTGVQDEEEFSVFNWIKAGTFTAVPATGNPLNPANCNFNDKEGVDDLQRYENLLANNSLTESTWAPYALAATENKTTCGFGVAANYTNKATLEDLRSVDVVFTADKSKWSRCVVVEMQDTAVFAQGGAAKHTIRRAAGWNLDMSGDQPVYSTNPADSGFSYFPGYAIDQETGERLNIFFGEDSYQSSNNGRDMIWNPTQNLVDFFGNPIFGGKHYIYVTRRRYDECKSIASDLRTTARRTRPWQETMWVGTTMPRQGIALTSLSNGLIPTTTRLRFRVTRPYAAFRSDSTESVRLNNDQPRFRFSTRGMGATAYDAASGRGPGLLDSIYAVPNPYYGYAGYEQNRLDTRVRIIRLPRTATISIYSLDGSLVRRLTKDDPNVSYIDWDLRNARGLPISSGMYLIHVNATGIGETVIKWFGALRPVDVTNF